ncbi:MAG: SDR family NAD(P)-dependent oxidoreductase [Pseudomonadales bacterium]
MESATPIATEPRAASLHAVVVGASGGLGAAFTEALCARPNVARVFALSRREATLEHPRLTWLTTDVSDPERLGQAATAVGRAAAHVHLLITCTGTLHHGQLGPEKALRELEQQAFAHMMTVNALVPLQVLAAFAPLLRHSERAVAATLSAMVGSIGDNRLGGWYSYRMSKAALNMGLKNAAIELARGGERRPGPIVVAVHPGTTRTPLSAPYLRNRQARSPAESAGRVLAVLDALGPADSGRFLHWDGSELPW